MLLTTCTCDLCKINTNVLCKKHVYSTDNFVLTEYLDYYELSKLLHSSLPKP